MAFPCAVWRVWMCTSGLWLPLRVRNPNHKGCGAKAGTVPKDLSTLKSERAWVKAVALRAMEDVNSITPAGDPLEVTAPSHTVQTEKKLCIFPHWNFGDFRCLTLCKAFCEITESVKVHSPFCYSLTAFSSLVCHSVLLLLRARERDDRAKGSTDNIKKPEKQGKRGNIVSSFSYSHLFPCWKAACGLRSFTLHFTQKLRELFSTYHWRGMAQCSCSQMVLNHHH